MVFVSFERSPCFSNHCISDVAVEFDRMLSQESTEAMLNLSCTNCGKPCRSQTEVDLHKKRTGHENYVDKVLLNLKYDRFLSFDTTIAFLIERM